LNLVREVSADRHAQSVNELSQRVTELIQQTFHYYYVAIFSAAGRSTFFALPIECHAEGF
jgi:hypothetical protein